MKKAELRQIAKVAKANPIGSTMSLCIGNKTARAKNQGNIVKIYIYERGQVNVYTVKN